MKDETEGLYNFHRSLWRPSGVINKQYPSTRSHHVHSASSPQEEAMSEYVGQNLLGGERQGPSWSLPYPSIEMQYGAWARSSVRKVSQRSDNDQRYIDWNLGRSGAVQGGPPPPYRARQYMHSFTKRTGRSYAVRTMMGQAAGLRRT